MPREKEGFRENLALLNERFPDRDMLRVVDVMAFTGMSRNTVVKKIRFNAATSRVSKADLARQISV